MAAALTAPASFPEPRMSSDIGAFISARVDQIRRQAQVDANEKRLAEIEGGKDITFLRVSAERAYRAFTTAWVRYQERLSELDEYERRRATEGSGR